MYERELERAAAIARVAGEAALAHYNDDLVADTKIGADNHGEPVTAADLEASRIIVEDLSFHFPEDAILSEEESDDIENRLGRERVWIIDPIDGTAGFIKKDGDFAVQIGLAEKGVPVLGVVLLPFHDVMSYAAKGVGAFAERGGSRQRLAVSSISNVAEVNLAVSRNHRSPRMSRVVEEFGFLSEVQRGSVGLKVGLIADRECDVYINLTPRSKMWDTCAPQIILEEAGGRLTDLWGSVYRYDIPDVQNWRGIVASNGAIHREVIGRLSPLLDEFGLSSAFEAITPVVRS
jgi:3'(2'), 5'-bisphosphate nucleotidase